MHPTTKLYCGIGIALVMLAATATFLLLSTKHLDAKIELQKDALYETDLGYVNIRKFDIGDVLIESATGKHQRIGNIASKFSSLKETEPVAVTRMRLKSGLNLSLSLEVPEDVKAQLQSEVMKSIELRLTNSRRKTLDRDAISKYLESKEFLRFLDGIHWNIRGAKQRVFVVSTVYKADELEVELKDFTSAANSGDAGKIRIGKYEATVNMSSAADLLMKGGDITAIFEFSPYIWSPADGTLKLNQNYPYW